MAKKRTSFSLSEKTIEQLKLIAKKNNRSMANMVEELIKKEYLNLETTLQD